PKGRAPMRKPGRIVALLALLFALAALHSIAMAFVSGRGQQSGSLRLELSQRAAEGPGGPGQESGQDLELVQQEELDGATVSVLFFVVAGALVLCCLQGEVNSGVLGNPTSAYY
ncbi:unnamed protein product, partial [Symbiodinium microadriaticum]